MSADNEEPEASTAGPAAPEPLDAAFAEFIADIEASRVVFSSGFCVIAECCRRGIPTRLLGRLRSCLTNKRVRVMIESSAACLVLHGALCRLVARGGGVSEVVEAVNSFLCIDTDKCSDLYWQEVVCPQLNTLFDLPGVKFRLQLFHQLVRCMQEVTGVYFSASSLVSLNAGRHGGLDSTERAAAHPYTLHVDDLSSRLKCLEAIMRVFREEEGEQKLAHYVEIVMHAFEGGIGAATPHDDTEEEEEEIIIQGTAQAGAPPPSSDHTAPTERRNTPHIIVSSAGPGEIAADEDDEWVMLDDGGEGPVGASSLSASHSSRGSSGSERSSPTSIVRNAFGSFVRKAKKSLELE